LNEHPPTEEKDDKAKDSIYEELQLVFHHFPNYHMKILSKKTLSWFNKGSGHIKLWFSFTKNE